MDEENIKTSYQEESWATIPKEIVIPKTNEFVNIKTNDNENLEIENIPLGTEGDFNEKNCIWGIKESQNNYKNVFIKNELYTLNDCVYCRSGLELDYIAKIMKLFEENDQKICTLRWFFRPFELPTPLKEMHKATNTQELFLAFGEGIGVENKNPLGVITSKCKVLCIAEDHFNDIPSSEYINMSDFFFKNAFNCDTLQIIGLDGVVDSIGAEKVYNKKEWLNWNKNDISSPIKTFFKPHDLYTLPTNSIIKSHIFSLEDHNSSSTTIKQSTMETLIKKRKRISLEKSIPSIIMMKKIKKMKLFTPSKNERSLVFTNFIKDEYETIKLESELKNVVKIIDTSSVETLSSEQILTFEGFNPKIQKTFGNGKMDESLENYTNLLSNVGVVLHQSIAKTENNVDNIHVTCQGSPTKSCFQPLKKCESSTANVKKNENTPQFVDEGYKINKLGEPQNSKKKKKKKKRTFDEEQKMALKLIQNKKTKKSLTFNVEIAKEKFTKTNFQQCNDSKIVQREEKMALNGNIQDQTLVTLHSHDFKKDNKNIKEEHEIHCIDDQEPLESPSTAKKIIIISDNVTKRECIGNLQNMENMESPTKDTIALLLKENFEPECEESTNEIQMTNTTQKMLLLHNIDPHLHSLELQDALSKFLDTKCQVQKITPNSFYYTTSLASTILLFPTQDIAQKCLQSLNKDHLTIGERTLIASWYEDLEFANKSHCFHGHICVQPKHEILESNHIEMNFLPHVAQGNTIEFTHGLQWRLLQEQHELQWQLLNEFHEKELNLLRFERKTSNELGK